MEWTDVEEEGSEEEEGDEEVGEEEISENDEAPSLLDPEGDEEMDEEELGSEEGSDEDEEEWLGFDGPESDGANKERNSMPAQAPVAKSAIDKPTSGIRYVPPHLRNRQAGSEAEAEKLSEEQIKLQRQLKGLLNRMSEQNISTILDSMEEIYRDHRRHGAF